MAVWDGSAVCVKKKRIWLRTGAAGELLVRSYHLSPFLSLYISTPIHKGTCMYSHNMTGNVCDQRYALPVFAEYVYIYTLFMRSLPYYRSASCGSAHHYHRGFDC